MATNCSHDDGHPFRPDARLECAVDDDVATARIRARDDATANDVLVAALAVTLARWNTEHGCPARRVGILVPVNLRPDEWRSDVVTNLVLNGRVLVKARDLADPERTMAAVTTQTRRLKAGGSGALHDALGPWSRLPEWAKRGIRPLVRLSGDRLVDTAVLSNLGAIDDPPDFGPGTGAARTMWFSAPARLPCGLSVGAVTLGGRLHLAMRYRHPLLGPAAMARLASAYVSTVAEVAGDLPHEPSTPGPGFPPARCRGPGR